ncbi:MAG: twin-arginine translocase subunit TatC [Deltaproteobacteria bacterium]|nr:twin-arginine translocase subunit TatC [Deltaproteobacteria bacterium]
MTYNPDEYRMPILEHLRELRSRIIVCLWALIVSFFAAFFFANELFGFLAAPMNEALQGTDGGTLAVTEAMEGFMVQMKVAAMTAIFISMPVLTYQSWRFIAPALYDQEKRWAVPLMVASTSLFLAGAAFAYFAVFRFGFPVFLEMNGEDVKAVLSIQSYLSFATTLLIAFGAAFQLPVVIYFLARIGVIDHLDLIRGFRYSVVLIFVVAAVLTPPDVLSQVLMAGPLLVLYGIGIGVARIATTKRRD